MDDVWDNDDQSTAEKEQRERDWKRMKENYVVEGFRESLEKTRENYLQSGFNDGFIEGFGISTYPQRIIASIKYSLLFYFILFFSVFFFIPVERCLFDSFFISSFLFV
jgi:hypothetical protein